jgi:hypothetical protein
MPGALEPIPIGRQSGALQSLRTWLPILTVTDLFRSEDWYRSLLSMESHRYVLPDGQVSQVILREPQSGLEMCLLSHPTSAAEPFSETRTGLDHLGPARNRALGCEAAVAHGQCDDHVPRS